MILIDKDRSTHKKRCPFATTQPKRIVLEPNLEP